MIIIEKMYGLISNKFQVILDKEISYLKVFIKVLFLFQIFSLNITSCSRYSLSKCMRPRNQWVESSKTMSLNKSFLP
jgi:hypothetical protein